MKDKFRYLEQKDRKKILLLCDDIRMHSGVATMAREIVVGSAHHFNWLNVGAAVKHPDHGKGFDISDEVNKITGINDASVKVLGHTGYGDSMLVRKLLKEEKPDAILIFTDPRYWAWLFDMEREIRTKIPIFYLNIWDDYPAPLYNRGYYRSVDLLMAISKQTRNINELVLEDYADDKVIEYVPHGINENFFFPIDENYEAYDKFVDFKKDLFKGKEIDFVVFWNSRNIHRKRPADVILSYRMFCDMIGEEKAKKCALIMHTQPVDNNGTDLHAVKEAFCDPRYVNVYFSADPLQTAQMNLLYNVSDVTMLISSNEGWGLSLTESMMAGKMILLNVTGGMQDQARFEDDNGKWIDFDANFPSNHRGTFTKCGEWAAAVFPSNLSVAGSPPTPYIYDDRCSPDDVASALKWVYDLGPEERERRGMKGREWALSKESNMSAQNMANRVIECCDKAFENFTPRTPYELIKTGPRPVNYVKHKLTDYTYSYE